MPAEDGYQQDIDRQYLERRAERAEQFREFGHNVIQVLRHPIENGRAAIVHALKTLF